MIVDGVSIVFHIFITHVLSYYIQESTLVIVTSNITFILSLVLTFVIERKFAIWKLDASYFSITDKFEDYKYFLV